MHLQEIYIMPDCSLSFRSLYYDQVYSPSVRNKIIHLLEKDAGNSKLWVQFSVD